MFESSVICNKCGTKLTYHSNIHKNILIMLARDCGWTKGETSLMPKMSDSEYSSITRHLRRPDAFPRGPLRVLRAEIRMEALR